MFSLVCRFGDDEIKSVASYPFMALLWVENPSQSRRNYTIQVRSVNFLFLTLKKQLFSQREIGKIAILYNARLRFLFTFNMLACFFLILFCCTFTHVSHDSAVMSG